MEYDMNGLFARGKIDSPCLNCTSREVGCHGTCEAYLCYADSRKDLVKRDYRPSRTYKKSKV